MDKIGVFLSFRRDSPNQARASSSESRCSIRPGKLSTERCKCKASAR